MNNEALREEEIRDYDPLTGVVLFADGREKVMSIWRLPAAVIRASGLAYGNPEIVEATSRLEDSSHEDQ